MNNNYDYNNQFYRVPPISGDVNVNGIPTPVPYAENVLKKNIGKYATIYMSYSDSVNWKDKIFSGIIEDSGRDYVILKDTNSEKRTVLWTLYLDYVEFNEAINF
ncbi:MAG: spore coat protein GerQ [Bacilli bacterium]